MGVTRDPRTGRDGACRDEARTMSVGSGAPTASPVRGVVATLQRLLVPADCLACGRSLGAGRQALGLCLPCRGRLRRPEAGCAVCGAPLPAARMRELADGFTCGACRARPPAYDRLIARWHYAGPIGAVIGGLKYRRLDYLGSHLAQGLGEAIREAIESGAGVPRRADRSPPWDLVVPVPLHWRRRLLRGFNQAERIARPLARELGVPFGQPLRRRVATRAQARLVRSERLENPVDAFAVRGRRPVDGLSILLVDDVVTTGATLGAAALALRRAGAVAVTAAAAARTPMPGER